MKPDLDQLRDIHLPEPVSWWPPAPGWWLLLALSLAVAGFAAWWLRRRRAGRWRREALAEWRRLRQRWGTGQAAPPEIVAGLSVLLRRVAISRYPRAEAASLTGEDWLAFLDARVARGDAGMFRRGAGRALIDAPYNPRARADMDALFTLCKQWIERLPHSKGQA